MPPCAARSGGRGFRIVHYRVQGNHLHLIVEADGARTLALRVRGLAVRLARGLNRMMGRSGPVLADRYDAHVLRTPAEVRNAVRYAVGNFESHAVRRGEAPSTGGGIDPFSSAAMRAVPRAAARPLLPQRSMTRTRRTNRPGSQPPRRPDRRRDVVVEYTCDGPARGWIHTHGVAKLGQPELELRNIPMFPYPARAAGAHVPAGASRSVP